MPLDADVFCGQNELKKFATSAGSPHSTILSQISGTSLCRRKASCLTARAQEAFAHHRHQLIAPMQHSVAVSPAESRAAKGPA